MVHHFPRSISECELPLRFTFPFCYTPHPLCVEAASLVQRQIDLMCAGQAEVPGGDVEAWKEEVERGKMFGVLLVRSKRDCSGLDGVARSGLDAGEVNSAEFVGAGQIGFLAAFSGNICGTNRHPYFVPPVYDLLDPEGFFKPKEAKISTINHEIDRLEQGEEYAQLREDKKKIASRLGEELDAFRSYIKEKKAERNRRRAETVSAEDERQLVRESQFLKAELKRKERKATEVLAGYDESITALETRIGSLKEERKTQSAQLQNEIFERYVLHNARGESKNIIEIFDEYSDRIPPAGTGECAAPKLLQYAYLHELEPLAMAEFWWGRSPVSEIRHHGCFYPSCHSKCEPLLTFMLEGLEVEDNPLTAKADVPNKLKVAYEDDWLMAVVKPAGLLSAPGKPSVFTTAQNAAGQVAGEGAGGFTDRLAGGLAGKGASVYSLIHEAHPEFTGPLIIHRLDMATSGLLLVAKSMEAYLKMQQLFESRQVEKRYIAVLDGVPAGGGAGVLMETSVGDTTGQLVGAPVGDIAGQEGVIGLPLCPDVNDRPRQMVSYEFGKEAVTKYKILSVETCPALGGGQSPEASRCITRVAFWPLTGRTHQLRVHAAHPDGLGVPILGDTLYGSTLPAMSAEECVADEAVDCPADGTVDCVADGAEDYACKAGLPGEGVYKELAGEGADRMLAADRADRTLLGGKTTTKVCRRLHLHAEYLSFIHPFTGKLVQIYEAPEF